MCYTKFPAPLILRQQADVLCYLTFWCDWATLPQTFLASSLFVSFHLFIPFLFTLRFAFFPSTISLFIVAPFTLLSAPPSSMSHHTVPTAYRISLSPSFSFHFPQIPLALPSLRPPLFSLYCCLPHSLDAKTLSV